MQYGSVDQLPYGRAHDIETPLKGPLLGRSAHFMPSGLRTRTSASWRTPCRTPTPTCPCLDVAALFQLYTVPESLTKSSVMRSCESLRTLRRMQSLLSHVSYTAPVLSLVPSGWHCFHHECNLTRYVTTSSPPQQICANTQLLLNPFPSGPKRHRCLSFCLPISNSVVSNPVRRPICRSLL